jgi:dTDP-4-amino-4,6-dideoxygalactose transaminase
VTVPFAAPSRLWPDEAGAVRAAVESVLSGPSWVGGEPVATFEADFAAYLGAGDREVVGVGNGTDALAVALGALGLHAGDGVLVADDEGGYAATAASQLGLRVRVMDVGVIPKDASEVAAVVVTHLHGDAVPLGALDAWRREHGLLLVEDCAQAHGLRVEGRHVGLVGDAATFSFYPTKNLGAVGDGGAVLLSSDAASAARSLREYGWGERYRVERAGGRNSRLDTLQAAVLSARLPFLDARNERRRAIANRYRDHVPLLGDPVSTVAHHAVALLDDRSARDALRARLESLGIMTAVHYPWLVSEMPGLVVEGGPSPVAADRRDRMLSLPCFPEMADAEVDRVCEALS